MRRARPARKFGDPPLLTPLYESMVVRVQLFFETVFGLDALGPGHLWFEVRILPEPRSVSAAHQRQPPVLTQRLRWPRARFWHEVVSLTPDALSDLVELRLFHRPDVDEPSSSEATFFRDPRVEQILKDQARYDYVLRTYIKYL